MPNILYSTDQESFWLTFMNRLTWSSEVSVLWLVLPADWSEVLEARWFCCWDTAALFRQLWGLLKTAVHVSAAVQADGPEGAPGGALVSHSPQSGQDTCHEKVLWIQVRHMSFWLVNWFWVCQHNGSTRLSFSHGMFQGHWGCEKIKTVSFLPFEYMCVVWMFALLVCFIVLFWSALVLFFFANSIFESM